MRCPVCNKFVFYKPIPSVEIQDETPPIMMSKDKHGVVTLIVDVEVRMCLVCVDCGAECEDLYFDITLEASHDCLVPDAESGRKWDRALVVEGSNRIQSPSQMGGASKMFYGAKLNGVVECLNCGEKVSLSGEDEDEASAFYEVQRGRLIT